MLFLPYLPYLRWIHLVAAATWTGGLVVMAAVVATLRKAGVERPTLQLAARQFGRLSWTALIIAMITGLLQVSAMGMAWTYSRLHLKLGLVGLIVLITVTHQLTAKQSSPAVRGAVELVILVLSLGTFAAAVAM